MNLVLIGQEVEVVMNWRYKLLEFMFPRKGTQVIVIYPSNDKDFLAATGDGEYGFHSWVDITVKGKGTPFKVENWLRGSYYKTVKNEKGE